MPLPTNQNSTPSEPQKRPEAQELPSSATLEEFRARAREEAMERKRAQQAQASPRQEATTEPPRPPRQKPKLAKTSPPAEEAPKGWKTDAKTGKAYKTIPKSEYDSEGNPILHLDDLNLDDLNGEANKYLAHLRVPPDREEMARLREEKAARARASTAAYNRANAEDDE